MESRPQVGLYSTMEPTITNSCKGYDLLSVPSFEASMKQPEDLLAGEDGIGTTPAAFRAPEGGSLNDRPLTLPPNTSLARFQDYMGRVADIVGNDNVTVISSDAELQHEHYLDPSKAHDVSKPSRMLVAGSKSADGRIDVPCHA